MRFARMSSLLVAVVLTLTSVASVSADAIYTDDFNRADSSADLGPNWSAALSMQEHNIVSNIVDALLMVNEASYYTNAVPESASHVTASIDFRASEWPTNTGYPNVRLGINYTGAGAGAINGYTSLMVQGTAACLFMVDGNWRGTGSLAAPLTVGDWYTMTVDQNGADFTGTLSKLDGTVLVRDTYTSQLQTSSTGAAWFYSQGWSEYGAGPAFDNFSLTVSGVPEPSALMLLATGVVGLLAYAWRKRK